MSLISLNNSTKESEYSVYTRMQLPVCIGGNMARGITDLAEGIFLNGKTKDYPTIVGRFYLLHH